MRQDKRAKKRGTLLRLATTYANRKNDREIFAAWRGYVGRWVARDESGGELISVVFAPRLPRPGKDKPHGTLSGFIAAGENEGALFFEGQVDEADRDREILLVGDLYKADRELTRFDAELAFMPGRQKSAKQPANRRLVLHIKRRGAERVYPLEWEKDVNDSALSTVSIIGHRGLGFDGLDNRPLALRHAWYFGASGIEFDITVPYEYSSEREGESFRTPLTDQLVVYHPPLHWQTPDINVIPEGFSPAQEVFEQLDRYWVPYVYVDPKVQWLSADDIREVLGHIIALANTSLGRASNQTITIAAAVDKAAEFLGGREGCQSSPYCAPGRLSWTLEWTEVEKPKNVLAGAEQAPSALSFSLRQIDGSMKRPVVEWSFTGVTKRDEKAIKEKSQILIFWTANDGGHFSGSLNAAKDPKRMGRPGVAGEIGIMTDYPHRLAYWLGTSPGRAEPDSAPSE